MVNFTEIKEQITASFENGKGFPTDLALDGSALDFSQPDDQSLAITPKAQVEDLVRHRRSDHLHRIGHQVICHT